MAGDQIKRGDEIALRAVVDEVRADGTVILRVPASSSLIPAVVISTVSLLGGVDRAPAPAINPFGIGARVLSLKGERGQVVRGNNSIPMLKRLQGREDVIMVQWEGRRLPTWVAPDEVKANP